MTRALGQRMGWREALGAWVTLVATAGTAPGQDACRVAKVSASDPVPFGALGTSVSVSGGTALAGTLYYAAYVFGFDGTTWVQTQKLLASDGPSANAFGTAVSIDGTRAMIGAPGDDDGAVNAGAVYYFLRNCLAGQRATGAESGENGLRIGVEADGFRADAA